MIADRNDLPWLRPCLESITGQGYPYWELHIFTPKSMAANVQKVTRSISAPGGRITQCFDLQEISTVNQALEKIDGQFVVFPGAGDLLAPAALFEVARLLNKHPEADVIYADEDLVDAAGKRGRPFL